MASTTAGGRLTDTVGLDPFGVLIQAPSTGVSAADLPVAPLRWLARDEHLVVLRGFDVFAEADELAAWCATWGEIMMWPFGAVLDLVEAETPTDHIFDHSEVPLHWDGMYKPYIPEFQIFQCVTEVGAGDGGHTTFCHTGRVLSRAEPATVERWRGITVTYGIENVVHYGGEAVSPLVVPHPSTGEPTLRFNEPPDPANEAFLNRPRHRFDGVAPDEVPALLTELHDALADPACYYEHVWQRGDIVIADNYTLLHGRTAFTPRAPRHVRRVHVLGDPSFANPAVG